MEEAIWQENPNLFYEILGEKVEMSPYVEKDGVEYEIHEKVPYVQSKLKIMRLLRKLSIKEMFIR